MGWKGEIRLNICEMVCKSGRVISSSFVLLGPSRGGLANMKTIHAVFTHCAIRRLRILLQVSKRGLSLLLK
jgi:hypothetical protein